MADLKHACTPKMRLKFGMEAKASYHKASTSGQQCSRENIHCLIICDVLQIFYGRGKETVAQAIIVIRRQPPPDSTV